MEKQAVIITPKDSVAVATVDLKKGTAKIYSIVKYKNAEKKKFFSALLYNLLNL